MFYSGIHNLDVANGPGIRVSLFVSGCPHHCPYCFNKDTWDYNYGNKYTEETTKNLIELLGNQAIKGFTLLGGEPFAIQNQEQCAKLLKEIKEAYPEKQIWCFTGFLFDRDILNGMCKKYDSTNEMLKYIDVLVDGPFLQKYKNPSLLFKGSENQKTIDIQKSIKEGKEILLEGYNNNLIIVSDEEIKELKKIEYENFLKENNN